MRAAAAPRRLARPGPPICPRRALSSGLDADIRDRPSFAGPSARLGHSAPVPVGDGAADPGLQVRRLVGGCDADRVQAVSSGERDGSGAWQRRAPNCCERLIVVSSTTATTTILVWQQRLAPRTPSLRQVATGAQVLTFKQKSVVGYEAGSALSRCKTKQRGGFALGFHECLVSSVPERRARSIQRAPLHLDDVNNSSRYYERPRSSALRVCHGSREGREACTLPARGGERGPPRRVCPDRNRRIRCAGPLGRPHSACFCSTVVSSPEPLTRAGMVAILANPFAYAIAAPAAPAAPAYIEARLVQRLPRVRKMPKLVGTLFRAQVANEKEATKAAVLENTRAKAEGRACSPPHPRNLAHLTPSHTTVGGRAPARSLTALAGAEGDPRQGPGGRQRARGEGGACEEGGQGGGEGGRRPGRVGFCGEGARQGAGRRTARGISSAAKPVRIPGGCARYCAACGHHSFDSSPPLLHALPPLSCRTMSRRRGRLRRRRRCRTSGRKLSARPLRPRGRSRTAVELLQRAGLAAGAAGGGPTSAGPPDHHPCPQRHHDPGKKNMSSTVLPPRFARSHDSSCER